MNHCSSAALARRKPVVRPRDAASLILLRGAGKSLEVLAGRRPRHAKFMPGVYVFPGGAIDPPDRIAWTIEAGVEVLGTRLARSARAAVRETWEEAGVLIGRPAGWPSAPPVRAPIEQAYLERGLAAALDLLTYAGNVDNLPARYEDGSHRLEFWYGDVRNAALVDSLVARADAVLHFASPASPVTTPSTSSRTTAPKRSSSRAGGSAATRSLWSSLPATASASSRRPSCGAA